MVRVHELARELKCTSNELLEELVRMGSEAQRALSLIPAEDEKALRLKFGGGKKGSSGIADQTPGKTKSAIAPEPGTYDAVRLKSKETGVKREFKGTEQSAASTLAPRQHSKGPSRQRETTSTKIIKKTIVRKRFVRSPDQDATPATVEQKPQTQPPPTPPRDEKDNRQQPIRRSLLIEGGRAPRVEKPEAPPVVLQTPQAQKPPAEKKPGIGQVQEPRKGEKRTVQDSRDRDRPRRPPQQQQQQQSQQRDRRPGAPPPPPVARDPKAKEVDLQKSLEKLQKKGISSDLTAAGRGAAKKTTKKRKKILSQDGDRRFTGKPGGSRVKTRSRDDLNTSRGPVARRKSKRRGGYDEPAKTAVLQRRIKVTPSMTIKDLSEAMGIKANEIIKFLVSELNVFATINQVVDLDIIKLILDNFDFEYDVRIREVEDEIEHEVDKEEDLIKRPPVVVVLGHVDHGKTKLLDSIRHANVIDTEAGAITQHIGAYQATINEKKITFLDTPGHEAFTAMRARGAQVTDIAILVVACDDGVMPQTIEAINHARDAGLEIIVALNKVDKDQSDPERVKTQLTEYGLVPEDWGGKTIMVPISAKFGQGIDDLLEMVLLSADILNLKGNPTVKAAGTVLESRLDKGLGPVATVLIQRGLLKAGDIVVCGPSWGKVRQMLDDKGKLVLEAGPSTPILITGLSEVPGAGEKLFQVKDEKVAKDIYNQRMINQRKERIHAVNRISLEDFFKQLEKGVVKDLNLILKADVKGSVEALVGSLERLSTDDVKVRFVHTGVGEINENDVMLALASNAIIIGFTVGATANAKRQAASEGVDIRVYDIIYKVVENIQLAIEGMLEPEYEERIIGRAEIRAIFRKTKESIIVGMYVTEGSMIRGMSMRIFRGAEKIYEGRLNSLKRFQEDVKEVDKDYECGMLLEGFNDLQEKDIIEGFKVVEISKLV